MTDPSRFAGLIIAISTFWITLSRAGRDRGAGNQKGRLLKAFKGHHGCVHWRPFYFGMDAFANNIGIPKGGGVYDSK